MIQLLNVPGVVPVVLALWLGGGCSNSSSNMAPTGAAGLGALGGSGAPAETGSGGTQTSVGVAAGSGVTSGGVGAVAGSRSAAVAGSPSAAGSGVPSGGAGTPAGNAGSGGAAGLSSTTTSEPDCSPSAWKDPGTVPNPKVASVAADAGTTHKLWGATKNIESLDILEEEFFFTGSSPAYTTRLVVHRPKNAAKFTGTVYMEWYNVTGGIDIGPLWATSREYFAREGHVHVGVSAQAVGANALKTYDAQRYSSINHPGDTAANAIFSQAAMAIRAQTEMLLGPCMPVDAVIAVGQSQSSAMLGTYLSSAHASAKIYDGFMLHSAPFGSPPANPGVPVFVVFTMNEANGTLVEGEKVREWEVAGATHNDAHLTGRGNEEQGSQMAGMSVSLQCAKPLNNFPSFWVYNAALDWLHRWVRKGEKPPAGDPIKTGMMDQHGNVQGGVRTQDIDVPIATYTSSNSSMSPLDIISSLGCGLGGSFTPFTLDKLMQLYPTHDDYVQKYTQAAEKAVAAGFLLRADFEIAVEKAKKAPIPK